MEYHEVGINVNDAGFGSLGKAFRYSKTKISPLYPKKSTIYLVLIVRRHLQFNRSILGYTLLRSLAYAFVLF